MFHTSVFKVGARDTDPFGLCRPSSVLDMLQEAATAAAIELHVSRDETIARYHAFWMLARMWYRLDSPIRWGDEITVKTWHRGGKGVSMYRDFDLYRGEEMVGEAVSLWVLADLDTHRLFHLSEADEFALTSGGALCKDKLLTKLHMPEDMSALANRALHYSDCDVNGHVNNVRYADFICDALNFCQTGAGKYLSELQLCYLKECRAGEQLSLSGAEREGRVYVRGDGLDGTTRFDAALTIRPLDKQ